jgi:hypothetical protein
MTQECICTEPGMCTRYLRYVSLRNIEICSGKCQRPNFPCPSEENRKKYIQHWTTTRFDLVEQADSLPSVPKESYEQLDKTIRKKSDVKVDWIPCCSG